MLDGKMSEEEYEVLLATTYTREAMGECQHGFFSWITKEVGWA